jgi:hypothetical protein
MEYRTLDLPFAAYLFTTKKLRFLRCEPQRNDARMLFAFDDPDEEGGQLHIEFESGAEVSAAVFYDAVKHLRRVMTAAQGKVLNEGVSNGRR